MNLSINREQVSSSMPCMSDDYKVKARLNASEEEVRIIKKHNLEWRLQIASLPSKKGPNETPTAVYVGAILNRDWEHKFWQMEQAATAEHDIVEGCKQLKALMAAGEDSGPKNIEL